MTSNTSIKDCITQLCRLLKHAPIPIHVNPETFRQAKQNRSAVVEEMFKMVSTLLKNVDAEYQAGTQFDVFVTRLKDMGYPRTDGIGQSSLELLLCFGWLLHATKVLSHIFRTALQPTDIFSVLLHVKHSDVKHSSVTSDSINDLETMFGSTLGPVQHHSDFENLSLAEKMNYLSWMFGKIEVKFNAVNSLYLYSSKINAKVKRKTITCKKMGQCLSADEVLLLKHPKLIQMCEKDLERKMQIVQSYQKWRESEKIFWQWLHSLVDTEQCNVDWEPNSAVKISACDDLQDDLAKACGSLEELKTTLYEKQRDWLEVAKSDSDRLSKVRVEQEHQIAKQVQVLLQHANNLDREFKLRPCTAPNHTAPSATIPISRELERIRALALDVASQLHRMEQLCAEELTMIVNTKVGENGILVPAADSGT